MKLKAVSGITLTLLLIGTLTLASNIQLVKASGTIYIRADGSVDPPTAPISSVDNVTYTFTADIYDSIVVQRDDIVVDGADYTVQGTGSGTGIDLTYRNNVTLKNVEATNFTYGIHLGLSSNNVLTSNTVSNNDFGIWLYSSSNNVLTGNTASNNHYGIYLLFSSNNVLTGNNASNNTSFGIHLCSSSNNNVLTGNNASNNFYGIPLHASRNNTLFHNNFINNTFQASVWPTTGYVNTWDDGYPSGGNYWSDYTGVDLYSGPYQNETGSDGIGDSLYVIDWNNQDNYPLMNPWSPPPPPVASADLVRRSAWPEHHHFVLSKDGNQTVYDRHGTPGYQTLYGKVGNTETGTLEAGSYKVVWTVTDSSGSPVGNYETVGTVDLAPGDITDLTYDVDPSALGPGKYYVSAQCWYNSTAGAKIKKFSFTIVP